MAEGPRCVRECTHGLYYASGRFCIPCGENCPKSRFIYSGKNFLTNIPRFFNKVTSF